MTQEIEDLMIINLALEMSNLNG